MTLISLCYYGVGYRTVKRYYNLIVALRLYPYLMPYLRSWTLDPGPWILDPALTDPPSSKYTWYVQTYAYSDNSGSGSSRQQQAAAVTPTCAVLGTQRYSIVEGDKVGVCAWN